jgi:glycosyltransferase involved in cell wall biosynthesis
LNKTKILNVIPSLQDGGIESLIFKLYKDLDRDKYRLEVCCLANIEKGYSYARFIGIGCNVKTFNFINTNRKAYHLFINFFEFIKLLKYLRMGKFNIVHSQDFFSATVTRIALLILRLTFYKPAKNYVTLHNMQHWLNRFHRIINKLLSYSTDKIICISKSVFSFSLENDKIAENKYKIIFNGINTNEFKQNKSKALNFRKELGYDVNDFIIGHVGTFSVRKGHKYLLKAFAELHAIYSNIKIILVGGYRTHEPQVYNEVMDIIEQNGLSLKVSIFKTRDDIFNLYNIFDLYVMPSTVEGFGLALTEAMSMGKIVIASDIPPFKEIIEDGKNGFLFKSKNFKDLKNKIENVMTFDASYLEVVSINARNKIVKQFNSDIMKREYDKLYEI